MRCSRSPITGVAELRGKLVELIKASLPETIEQELHVNEEDATIRCIGGDV